MGDGRNRRRSAPDRCRCCCGRPVRRPRLHGLAGPKPECRIGVQPSRVLGDHCPRGWHGGRGRLPSVQPVDLLGGTGVISIAAGIAFQTVLGNMFAGLVLLSREALNVGDQVDVDGIRGTITAMALTTTTVRTFESRQVLLPNSTMHPSVVVVQTGYETVRTSVRLDLDDTTDLSTAKAVALSTMADLAEVASQPEPEALLVEVGTGTLSLELRFWSGARQLQTLEAQDAVISATITAFRQQGVRTGSRVQVVEAAEDLRRALNAIEIIPARPRKDDQP